MNPTLTIQYTGLVNGETPFVLGTVTITTTATVESHVGGGTGLAGGYPITASGAVDANYAITYVPALTVTRDDELGCQPELFWRPRAA